MTRFDLTFRELRSRLAANLEALLLELEAPDWERAVTSKPRASTDLDPTSDLGVVAHAMRTSANSFASSGRNDKKAEAVIDRLSREYGVEMTMPVDMGEPSRVAFESKKQLAEAWDLAEAELGIVGTPFRSGRAGKEPTGKYAAFTVRGASGNPGLYEEYWASESQIFDAVQGHIETLVSGDWSIQMPEFVEPSQKRAMREFVEYHNARIRNVRCMMGGFQTFVAHAGTIIPFGFSLFEPIFGTDSRGRLFFKRAGFREQATVDLWYSTESGDKITCVDFKTSGDDSRTYSLPATSEPKTNHLIWSGLHAFGSNWEGRPPTRPALHWVKMKRLIAQIVPLAAEKYGVPISYIRADTEYMKAIAAGMALNPPNLAAAYDAFKDARAVEGPIFKFADGVVADVVSPPNQMPGLDEWIRYCDQMISYTFSNEGNLLGMQSATGSYALGEVKERRFLRSAPAYARPIEEMLTYQVIQPLAVEQLGADVVELPRAVYTPNAALDAGVWLGNARTLFGPNLPLESWPEAYQRVAHRKMQVNRNELDEDESDDVAPSEPTLEAV